MQTSNNHAITIFQTFRHQPFIANRLSGGNVAHFDFVIRPDNQRARIATWRTGHTLLWNQKCGWIGAFFQTRANEHTWQQIFVRVRENRP